MLKKKKFENQRHDQQFTDTVKVHFRELNGHLLKELEKVNKQN